MVCVLLLHLLLASCAEEPRHEETSVDPHVRQPQGRWVDLDAASVQSERAWMMDHPHSHDPEPDIQVACLCDHNRVFNGWCRVCRLGHLAGLPIASAALLDALDTHGHAFDPKSRPCLQCQTAIATDGFCEACGFGYADNLLYASRLTWLLGRSDPMTTPQEGCVDCVPKPGLAQWCEPCQLGLVGHFVINDRELFDQASTELQILQTALTTVERCEMCGIAQFMGGICPDCALSYDGRRGQGGVGFGGEDGG